MNAVSVCMFVCCPGRFTSWGGSKLPAFIACRKCASESDVEGGKSPEQRFVFKCLCGCERERGSSVRLVFSGSVETRSQFPQIQFDFIPGL